jgi:hypothetical protein
LYNGCDGEPGRTTIHAELGREAGAVPTRGQDGKVRAGATGNRVVGPHEMELTAAGHQLGLGSGTLRGRDAERGVANRLPRTTSESLAVDFLADLIVALPSYVKRAAVVCDGRCSIVAGEGAHAVASR